MTYNIREDKVQLVRFTATDSDYKVGTFALYDSQNDDLWILLPDDHNNGVYDEDPLEINGELFRTSLWGYRSGLMEFGYKFEVIQEIPVLEFSNELLTDLIEEETK
jgi:hypothetical protein